MKRSNTEKMFKLIKSIGIDIHYNFDTQRPERRFYLIPEKRANNKWNLYFKHYVNKLTADEMDEIVTNGFIDNNTVSSIELYRDLNIKNLIVHCNKDKLLSISLPTLDVDIMVSLYQRILQNRENNIIDKYLSNEIDTIIVFPSNKTGEISFYKNLPEENSKNVLACFNFQKQANDECFLDISGLIYEIIEDFYDEHSNYIDGYYFDEKKTVISFSNNKRIELYDKEFESQIRSLLIRVQNELIENKLRETNNKRKVFKYGTNNNGKNGESM